MAMPMDRITDPCASQSAQPPIILLVLREFALNKSFDVCGYIYHGIYMNMDPLR